MTAQPTCDLCGDPTDGYCCRRCTDDTARYLQGALLAAEVETTVARLARYAVRHVPGRPDPDPDHHSQLPRPHEPPERFAWAARRELPEANALRPTELPVDLNASAKAAHAFSTVTTWARTVLEDRGGEPPEVKPGQHPAAIAAAYLLDELGWMRHQQFAAEAFDQLRAAGATIRRIVDSPPEQEIVGRCDCGAYLYARKGAATTTCPNRDCGQRWNVEESRQALWDALPGYLMTASEAALLLMLHGIAGKDRRRWAKTITMWAQRGHLIAHGEIDGAPAYLFGDVMAHAERTARGDAA